MATKEHLNILKNMGVFAWNKWRQENPSITPDVSGGVFRGLILRNANLSKTNFAGSDLRDVNFRHANLNDARLDHAKLYRSYFSASWLNNTSFHNSILYETVFSDVDLSTTIGLESCKHKGPSIIDHRTLIQSLKIPIEFLRGCGLPDYIINTTKAQFGEKHYHSCFISYSSKDTIFVEKMYSDLQENGVRCWFAPEDLKIGEKIRKGIDESILKHDKLLLVLSKNSVISEWVEQEVETALAREREENKTILFPIRLDDTIMEMKVSWQSLIKNTRNIGDFISWNNEKDYNISLERLLRDLKSSI